MKNLKIYSAMLSFLLISCGGEAGSEAQQDGQAHDDHHHDVVLLNAKQVEVLDLKMAAIEERNMGSYVQVNGQLEVPPKHEAEITAIIGANVQDIKVIEGQQVKKGQVLATIAHPDLIELQSDYIAKWNELQYLKTEFERQEKLYKEKVSSGKEFQKIKSEYNAKLGIVNGLESKLSLLGISKESLQENKIHQIIPVRSPIDGFMRKVEVRVGQYVNPSTPMFEIVNVEHVHADLMVFERDVHKVKEGQKVLFSVESLPGKELTAEIYAVGRNFESEPKAVHLHAELDNKEGVLIPGMYVQGKIYVEDAKVMALPEDAVVRDGDKYYVFRAYNHGEDFEFIPTEVGVGTMDNGWVEIKFLETYKPETKFALNNAYKILAELQKEGVEHSH
ncbi:MAG: efflux RND transporter periplasmic adaptor subunit [Crocinitomicaceae bacterium]